MMLLQDVQYRSVNPPAPTWLFSPLVVDFFEGGERSLITDPHLRKAQSSEHFSSHPDGEPHDTSL